MKAKLLNFKENLDQIILKGLVGFLLVWVIFALGFMLYAIRFLNNILANSLELKA